MVSKKEIKTQGQENLMNVSRKSIKLKMIDKQKDPSTAAKA